MAEKSITAKEAAPIIGKSRSEILRMAERGELDGTWFWSGQRRRFLESKLEQWREAKIQSASAPMASL